VELAFTLTAENEMHHAKTFFKLLGGGMVKLTTQVDAGVIASTARNLAIASREERTEGVDTYLAAARQAEIDGFLDIASRFRAMAAIEARHQQRYDALLVHVKHGTMWIRPNPITWHCAVCGYESFGTEPPSSCPACSHPHQHFLPMDIPWV
jgi:rubrerythrin